MNEIIICVRELKKVEMEAYQHLSVDGWLYSSTRSKTREIIWGYLYSPVRVNLCVFGRI